MSLEELKSKTKIKLTVMSISMLLPIIIIVVMGLGQWKIGESKAVFFEAPWVPYTVCAIFLGYLVYKNFNYIRILKCEEYANKVLLSLIFSDFVLMKATSIKSIFQGYESMI